MDVNYLLQICMVRRFSLAVRAIAVALVVGALCSVACPTTQAAPLSLLIDDFTAPQQIEHNGPGAHGPDVDTVLSGSILGGSRKLTLSSVVFAIESVNSRIVGGVANYESGTLSTGMQKYEYNGNGLGLGNLLAGASLFSLDLTSFNAGTFASTIIKLIANDGADHVLGSHTLDDTTVTPKTLNFDPTGSGTNFNLLKSLRLEFDSTLAKGADFTVTNFRATVPEPAMLTNLAWIAALGGMYAVRRQRP